MLEGIDDCKIGLNCPTMLILQHLDALKFEPILHRSILMDCYSRCIGYTRINHPVDAVLGAEIPGNASQPVVHDHVILDVVSPDDGIFKPSVHIGVDALIGDLMIGREAVATDPYAPSPAHHQKGTVFTTCKWEVWESFNDAAVTGIELELAILPVARQVIGEISASNDIEYIAVVFEPVYLRVVPFPDHIVQLERSRGVVADGVEHIGVGPLHVSFWGWFQPTAHHEMIEIVITLHNVSAPVWPDTILNAIVGKAGYDAGGAPCVGWAIVAFHGQEAIHKPPPFHQMIPFFRKCSFGNLGLKAVWGECQAQQQEDWQY